MRHRIVSLAALSLAFVGFTALAQETTGTLVGRTATGGAHVSASDGTRTFSVTSSADGSYSLALPPGDYTVSDGGDETTVRISAGRITHAEDGAPADTTAGLTLKGDELRRLPLRRDAFDILRITPGVTPALYGYSVYGSSANENAHFADGVHATMLDYGFAGATVPVDFVSEAQVMTAGYGAELGRSTGGIVNVVTATPGGKTLTTLFAYGSPSGLQSNSSHRTDYASLVAAGDAAIVDRTTSGDLGATVSTTLGERVFVFGGVDLQRQENTLRVVRDIHALEAAAPAPGSDFDRTTRTAAYNAKLEFRASDSLSLLAQLFGDPGTVEGVHRALRGAPSTFQMDSDQGSNNAALHAMWTRASWLFSASATRFRNRIEEDPDADIPVVQNQTVPVTTLTGGIGFYMRQRGTGEAFRLKAGHTLHAFGEHDLRAGFERERNSVDSTSAYTGGMRIDKTIRAGVISYRKIFYATPGSTLAKFAVAPEFRTEPTSRVTTLFVNDTWRPSANLTLSGGLRWERQRVSGDPVQELEPIVPLVDGDFRVGNLETTELAPRFSLAWAADGGPRVYGSYGRYYEQIPLDVGLRLWGAETFGSVFNFDPSPANVTPAQVAGRQSAVDPNFGSVVAEDLDGQRIDEVVVGIEHRVAGGVVAGIRGIERKVRNVIEDFACDDDTNFCIGNVGSGLNEQAIFIDPATFDVVHVPGVEARRRYRGAELYASQHEKSWNWFASYIYSRLEGNYDGLVTEHTGQVDPNITSFFDLANLTINRDGVLAEDRRHQIKAFGSAATGLGLEIGVGLTYASGTPLVTTGFDRFYGPGEFFATRRGEAIGRQRTPSLASLDLHAGYPLRAGAFAVELFADVFNATNRQSATRYDERWALNFGQNSTLIDPATGTLRTGLTPASSPNPDYQKARAWQAPREVRFGVRLRL